MQMQLDMRPCNSMACVPPNPLPPYAKYQYHLSSIWLPPAGFVCVACVLECISVCVFVCVCVCRCVCACV